MKITTRILPDTREAEAGLLGSILLNSAAMLAAKDLTPEHFSRNTHAILFATLRQLQEDGLGTDPTTVKTRLERTGQLARVGGDHALTRLLHSVSPSRSAHSYAEHIHQAAIERSTPQRGKPLASRASQRTTPNQPAQQTDLPEQQSSSRDFVSARAGGLGGTASSRDLNRQAPLSSEEARRQLSARVPSLIGLPDLLNADFPDVNWIVPGLLPEGLTLLAARTKLGKSWLALGLAWAVAAGGIALNKTPVEPGAVLCLALEDSPRRLSTRAWKLLQGDPPPTLTFATHWPRLNEGGLDLLQLWLQGHPDARLIIIDTLAKVRGRPRSASHYSEDYASLEAVQALAHQYSIAILVIHHTIKETRQDPLDEVNATIGLTGVADNILILRRQRGQPDATLLGDGRELTGIELSLHFDDDFCRWSIIEPSQTSKTPERAEILRLLQTSAEPMTPTQVARVLGKTPNAARKLLAHMVEDGALTITTYGKYTILPHSQLSGLSRLSSEPLDGEATATTEKERLSEQERSGEPASLSCWQAPQPMQSAEHLTADNARPQPHRAPQPRPGSDQHAAAPGAGAANPSTDPGSPPAPSSAHAPHLPDHPAPPFPAVDALHSPVAQCDA